MCFFLFSFGYDMIFFFTTIQRVQQPCVNSNDVQEKVGRVMYTSLIEKTDVKVTVIIIFCPAMSFKYH